MRIEKRWLDRNFPTSNDYSTYNIIFSPLVAYNQSSNWFESNGFKELQPHVNFPYPQDIKSLRLSPQAEIVYRGNIVFTEINHAFRGESYQPPTLEERWGLVRRHCAEEIHDREDEKTAMHGMRGRLMAYTRGMHGARPLRAALSTISSLAELDDLIASHLAETLGD